ncbi:MAG: hypothetical protein KF688_05230 [Pirellulales bacterium]|nr:hypothetical protein [Pirellulales bacterium]
MNAEPQPSLPLAPVLDVAGGRLVRAVAGRRNEYRPWFTPLAPHADPHEFVANAASLLAAGNKRQASSAGASVLPPLAVYGADLDALAGGEPNWPLWGELARKYALWCDAGLTAPHDVRRMGQLVRPRGGRVVLGTETADDAATLLERAAIDPLTTAVSFDWRGDRPLSRGGWLAADEWLDLAGDLRQAGVQSFVVLDVTAVGRQCGPTVAMRCQRLRERLPEGILLAGGGVRNANDVAALRDAGCDAVLTASWLHALAEEAARSSQDEIENLERIPNSNAES